MLDWLRCVLSSGCVVSYALLCLLFFFFSSRRRHTRYIGDWSSDVCSSDVLLDHLPGRDPPGPDGGGERGRGQPGQLPIVHGRTLPSGNLSAKSRPDRCTEADSPGSISTWRS